MLRVFNTLNGSNLICKDDLVEKKAKIESCLTPYVRNKTKRLKPYFDLQHGKNPSREEMSRPLEAYEMNV